MTADGPPSRGYRFSVIVRETVLWIGAAAGVLCLAAACMAVFFGVTPLVFRSGSMSPQIPTGSLALARTTSASDLAPGDVVSVIRADGERVTHRLVSEEPGGEGRWSLTIKGDANAAPDPEPVVTREVDRVFWSVPRVGFLLQGASKPQVSFPAGAVFGILALIGFRPPLDRRLLRDDGPVGDQDREPAHRPEGPRHARSGAALGIAILLTATAVTGAARWLPALAQPTLAAFSDSGAARSEPSFSAGALPAPATFTCTVVSLTQVQFSWTNPSDGSVAPTSYTLKNETSGAALTISSGSTLTATVAAPLFSVVGATPFTYSITANLGTWTAKAPQTRTVTALLSLLPTCV